jgi:hypothetical protein
MSADTGTTAPSFGQFGDIWARAREENERAIVAERADRDARQAAAQADLQARRAQWPENRAPEPPADATALREALRRAQEASRGAELRLRDALAAGQRGESHCTDVHQRLGAIDEIERKHVARLASILRAGGGDRLPDEVVAARASRPGLERDAQSADEACSTLAADIARAQDEVDSATAQVNAVAKMIMSSTARAIVDKIAEHEQAAAELWRAIEPLGLLYFAGVKGTLGSPVALDEATRKIFSSRPRLSGADDIPPQRQAAMQAAAVETWRRYFDALSTDPDAVFGTDCKT